ncbi:hypothetical protein EYR41_012013 [Orbilia oligospora]|uniref:Fungal N-terminal domain-containing protein n=1 Tax=Orbilia oligospora TaxID=2813651 RepID=A0A8H2DQ60_ORBOL|nr:hypothetical protein EYR41_012013 [Orbilia oligospora]
MAEVAGLVLGSVALVPLIKNVHNLYDSIKDAPKALQQYQVSTSRLLDTLEVIHTVSKTYNVFPENSRPWLAFHSYLADINNSCMELESLLKEKMKAEGKQIGTCKRVLWALLGRDEKAKELMNKIDRTTRSLHLLFNAMTSMANSTMHDAHAAQLTISTNAWVTSGENIASILDEVKTIKTILEGVRADTMIRDITTVAETARIINEDSPTEDDALGPPEGGSSTIIYRRHAYQPIEKKSGYYIGGKTFLRHEKLTAFLLKTQSTGRQSGVIIQSKYEIKVKLSSKFLGYNFHINIGLDIGARSLCPKFGLYYRRVIPESDLQYYYVKNHMFEEFRDLVVQGRASIYDLYDFMYEFCSTSSVIQFLGSHIEFGVTPQGRNRTYQFVTFLLQEGYKPDRETAEFCHSDYPSIGFKPYKSHGLPDSRYTKAIPKQCDDCDFATVECPNCGEVPLELQGEEFSESTSDEDDQLPISDSTVHLVSSNPQIEGLGVKLLAWSKFYLRRLGTSGILITVLSAAVSYLLYKLKQSENMRRSMLVYSEELGPGE